MCICLEGEGGSVVDLHSGGLELHSPAIISPLAPLETQEMGLIIEELTEISDVASRPDCRTKRLLEISLDYYCIQVPSALLSIQTSYH